MAPVSGDAGAVVVQEEQLLAEGEDQGVSTEHRVTPLELFFDLVFVFAITQVTAFMAADPSWDGMLDGLMVLAAVWWAWVGYAWLTNFLDPEETGPRLAIFAAMAAMLVVALCIPQAFGADAGLFVAALAVVRVLHVLVYGLASNDVDVRGAVARFAPGVALSMTLLAISTGFDGGTQAAIFGVALLVDFASPLAAGNRWKVHAGHFAERHGLIVIIALGESIVALGIGAEEEARDLQLVVTAAMGVAISAALWWAYFDVAAIVAERHLGERDGAERARMARDSYSYIHYLMIAGIVLFALGMKKTLGGLEDPLKVVPAFALACGPALFYVGHGLFRFRNTRTVSRTRPIAVVALVACWPLATETTALTALVAITAINVVLIAYETWSFGEARARIRAEARAHG